VVVAMETSETGAQLEIGDHRAEMLSTQRDLQGLAIHHTARRKRFGFVCEIVAN
jgi:hypothetical protein